mmetsp:Transcript_39825/g.101841  ORF Transcript_39825/g.101841 Transcript_39825/m.101841 type:complete len:81 (-) Transcript_39825:8-250(-)
MDHRPKHSSYTRKRWKKTTRHDHKKAWEAQRRESAAVKSALDDLSQSGGRRGTSKQQWTAYLDAVVRNKDALYEEFLWGG